MSLSNTATLDDKYRIGFVREAFNDLSWKEDFLEPNSTHFIGPGNKGQFIVVSGKKYIIWKQKLMTAAKLLGTSSKGQLAMLSRGLAGLTAFTVSIETKRVRFTLPKDTRSLCKELQPRNQLRVVIWDDLFEIYPSKPIVTDSFTETIGEAIHELRGIQDYDWSKLEGSS